MKTSKTLALMGALGLALAGQLACAQPSAPDQGLDRPPGPPPGIPFGQMLRGLLDKYDGNQDGILDQTELSALRKAIDEGKVGPPRRGPGGPRLPGELGRAGGPGGPQGRLPKDILDKYDVNKDGKLDESERAALHKDIEDGKIERPPRGPGAPPPPLTASRILEKFDADKDGKLDETELAAFVKDMKAHRPPPPPGVAGPGGPPPGDEPDAPPPQ